MFLKNTIPVCITQTAFTLVAHFLLHSPQLTAFGAVTAAAAFGLSVGWHLYERHAGEVPR